MSIYSKYLLAGLILSLTAGCCTGLYRNSLDEWERKDYPTLGFSIEMPTNCIEVCRDKLRNDFLNKYLLISLHSYYPMALTEPVRLINMKFVVLSKKDLVKYIDKKEGYFKEGIGVLHNNIIEYNTHWYNGTTPMVLYRKDYLTNDGGAILCGADYLKDFKQSKEEVEEDINAIKRMLDSVKVYPNIDTSNDLPAPQPPPSDTPK